MLTLLQSYRVRVLLIQMMLASAIAFTGFPIWAAAAGFRVVVTTSILMDLTRQIGGDDVDVVSLVSPNSDAHVYEPKPADLQALGAARMLIQNGLGLERWLPRLLETAGYKGLNIVAAEGVDVLTVRGASGEAIDPHAWQNPANAAIYIDNIAGGLAAADPARAQIYQRRAMVYKSSLSQLDKKIRGDLAQIPTAKRQVITTHDAFQYYGKAYGIDFIAPLGLSTDEGEPSAADLARLETQIRRSHIKALFLENMTDQRLMDQLARDTGAVVGPPLYSDALSPPGGPAATYADMLLYNTTALIAGMGKNDQ